MNGKDIERIAQMTGIAAERIARWHFVDAPRMVHSNAGRPKGKLKRPRGMLSLGDARQKFQLTIEEMNQYRNAGLKCKKAHGMILVKETELRRFLRDFKK